MIELRHLRKEYESVTPLKDVNVTINDGDIISVIGPSGNGKSTLIRCINLLEKPTSGDIIVNGTCITEKGARINEVRKKMGMVFQSFNLFEHLTIIENVMKPPMDLLGMDKQTAYDKAMSLLHMVGMDGRALDYPDTLSGGQKQRVAIARTLSMDPDIILFDEPTSALDPTMVGEVQAVIRELAGMGKTMLIVTHEMKFAREICNRVFFVADGGIYEDGTPEQIFENPQGELTRRFIRRLKVFETTLEDRNFDFIGMVGALEAYGYKNRIPQKTVYRIQSLFEELCKEILLPELPSPLISFAVEYDEKTETAISTVMYNGEPFDPADTDNFISYKILQHDAEEITYTEINEDQYRNKVVIRVK
ncbi:MAG: amino acid ABC transporter ATP-binding protein [Clostridiales bacterium]|nr:amino acid ABC transporter ATP-binding protein [Clostridiales bacterium]